MTPLRRPWALTALTVGTLALALLVSLLLGADAVSVALGAASVALSFMLVTGFWFRSAQRSLHRHRHRERRTLARARRRDRKQARQLALHQERVARQLAAGVERRLLIQLESRDWLARELDMARPLPPTRPYASRPDLHVELVNAIDKLAPEQVLELGSGISSIVIARRLQQAGKGRLVTLDHKSAYAEQTRAELAAFGVTERALVVEAPLVDVTLSEELWSWYELGPEVPARIDLLIVDGPPGIDRALARYPALPLLRDRLVPGAVIFLDDANRVDEQEIVRRWSEEIAGLVVREPRTAFGVAQLIMPGGHP